jgi:hypothetical protein
MLSACAFDFTAARAGKLSDIGKNWNVHQLAEATLARRGHAGSGQR